MEDRLKLEMHIYEDCDMAIYSLEKLLEDLEDLDNKIKGVIRDVLKGYKRYHSLSLKILQKNDIKPKSQGMIPKMGVSMNIKKEVLMDNSDASIASMLIDGISMGNEDINKSIKEDINALEDSVELAKDFSIFQKNNMLALEKFL